MRKITQQELENEFAKIISDQQGDINLSNGDLDVIITASKHKTFLLGKGEGNKEMGAYDALLSALEPLEYTHDHQAYLVHFTMHPEHPMKKVTYAMEIIHEIAHEDAEIIFGITSDKNLPTDYVMATAVIALNVR